MDGFGEARQGIEQELSGGAPESAPEQAPTQEAPQKEVSAAEQQEKLQELLDLDSVEKVRWKGKEWTRKELEESVMLRQDYTKKRQEEARDREYGATMRRYLDNLDADLDHVLKNRELAAEFKKIYPKEFHGYVDRLLGQSQSPQTATASLPPEFQSRFERVEAALQKQEQAAHEAEVKNYEKQIDATITKLSPKYPMADEETVLARAQAWLDANKDENGRSKQLTEEVWDGIFKDVHDRMTKRAEGHYKGLVEKQKQSHTKAKDVPAGGGIAAPAPKQSYKSLKDVQKAMLDSLYNE